jgi:hypothetical protein
MNKSVFVLVFVLVGLIFSCTKSSAKEVTESSKEETKSSEVNVKSFSKEETKSFKELGLTTDNKIASYLKVSLSDLKEVLENRSIVEETFGTSIKSPKFMSEEFLNLSPKDFFEIYLSNIKQALAGTLVRFMFEGKDVSDVKVLKKIPEYNLLQAWDELPE